MECRRETQRLRFSASRKNGTPARFTRRATSIRAAPVMRKRPRIKIAPPRVPASDSRRVKPSVAPKRGDPFYGSAPWKALMARLIAERGRRCQDPACQTPNRGQGGKIYGDHIAELRDGGAPLDRHNV